MRTSRIRAALKTIKHFFIVTPLLFNANCFSIHKPPPEQIESPKSNTLQNSNDSMDTIQKTGRDSTLRGVVPVRSKEKGFPPETEKKIESYIQKLLKAGGAGIELPSQDAWMAKEIQKRLSVPNEGYWYIVSIKGPDQNGNLTLFIVAKMRASSF